MNTILEAINVTQKYGGRGREVAALLDVELSIAAGSFTAIIGKSGSGKSTLLRILSGLEKPSAGTVLLEGKNLHQFSEEELAEVRRKRIGFVFQSFNLFSEFTVEENIKMPLFFDSVEPDETYISSMIDVMGLSAQRSKFPGQLSGGEMQRTAIARALAARPAIVFADEPTGNLDSATSQEVFDFLLLSRRLLGQTILMATHDMELAEQADRILTLRDGRIVSDRRTAL